jgi:hypothetical protein
VVQALRASGVVTARGLCALDPRAGADFFEGSAEGEGAAEAGAAAALRALRLALRWGLARRARAVGAAALRMRRGGSAGGGGSEELLRGLARCDAVLARALPPAAACVAMAHVPRAMLAVLVEPRAAGGAPAAPPTPAALGALGEVLAVPRPPRAWARAPRPLRAAARPRPERLSPY